MPVRGTPTSPAWIDYLEQPKRELTDPADGAGKLLAGRHGGRNVSTDRPAVATDFRLLQAGSLRASPRERSAHDIPMIPPCDIADRSAMTGMQKTKRNIGRIDHVIFAYGSHERAEKTRDKMTALLGLDLEAWMKPADLPAPFNLRTWVHWEAGLEIICPLEGCENQWFGTQILTERGEGICAVVFGVDDIDEACRRAEGLGLPVLQTMHDSRFTDGPDCVHRGLAFFFGDTIEACHTKIREALVSPFNGTGLAFGEFEPLSPKE